MERSLFTKIIDREIPATIEYEDDTVIAIRDVDPVAPVHLLIIPKKPLRSIQEMGPEDHVLMGHVVHVAQQLAEKFNISHTGYRLLTNVNADAGQTVFHTHFHLIGGEALGGLRSTTLSPVHKSHAHRSHAFWRDLAVFLVAAIGLAYGYNELNPKRIAWMRPEYKFDTLSTAPIIYPRDTLGLNGIATLDSAADRSTRQASLDSIKRATDSTKRAKELLTKGVDTTKMAPSAPCFTAESGVIKEISYDQFITFLTKECVILIDARIPESYAKGRIRNAINIDGTMAESPEVIPRLAYLARDKFIIIYCDGGECELSHRVAAVLKNFGYGPIYVYKGGWAEWSKKK